MLRDIRFHCDVCQDFDFCIQCFSVESHLHNSFTLFDLTQEEEANDQNASRTLDITRESIKIFINFSYPADIFFLLP
jgi:hypothetical protein